MGLITTYNKKIITLAELYSLNYRHVLWFIDRQFSI